MPKAPKAERLGLRAYAKRRGVTLAAVQKAIQSGRLAECLVRGAPSKRHPQGATFIDPAIADREWEANTTSAMQRERHRGPDPPEPEPTPSLFDTDGGPALPEGAGDGPPGPKKAESEALRMHYQAKLARLEWEERIGELVRADLVRKHAFQIAATVKEALAHLPERLAAQLAAEDDPAECQVLLQGALDRALHALADVIPLQVTTQGQVAVEAEA